ncbi:exported hypothetical protein [Vibrio coralliirubri]|uniref:type II secretion system protein n=1 Tax=Vibrio coralliirubri TaxID=1516159 RepID=UPI0006352EE1|nr:type II secretion system protein [Vibrio coralliirubri]CDT53128.1 exported hypothetical protein [Vibrio coralliirubri]
MKKQNGFTLIELVVVIVCLGILAVTAAPRFLNLQSDARESVLSGVKGAVQSANGIVYGKAAIEGKEKSEKAVIEAGGQEINVHYGNISTNDVENLKAAMNTDLAMSNIDHHVISEDGVNHVLKGTAFHFGDEKSSDEEVIATKCFLFVGNSPQQEEIGELKFNLEKSRC